MKKQDKLLSTLGWTKTDFESAGEIVPENQIEDDLHTEGELMTREEIDEFIADTHKVLLVASEHHPESFDKLFEQYVIDIHYLEELGKITPVEALELQKKENFTFN